MGKEIFEVRRAVHDALAPLAPATFGVACSGGADSIALVDAAAAVLGAHAVVVMHVDHGLRDDSAQVAHEVEAWARGRGLAALIRRVAVPRRASLEDAARRARYAALDQLAREVGVAAVLTAHTARDQAETVLMRLLRGTGVAGLAGIAAQRPGYVRPLLQLGRDAIEAYVTARALPTWHDAMNDDRRFLRVRVRQQVLPALRQENPALDAALCRLARQAEEWTDAIDALADPLAEPLRASALAAAPAAVRKRALALALSRHGLAFDASHLERCDALVMAPARGTQRARLPGGGELVREYDRLWVRRAAPDAAVGERRDGAERDDGALRQLAAAAAAPGRHAAPAAHLCDGAITERRPRPGDRMRPARLRGRSRKLSDLFIDAKVPRRLRASARVVCRRDDGEILWVEHLGAAWQPAADGSAPEDDTGT